MTMTEHGKVRLKQRSGVGKSYRKVERFAKNALIRGYRHSEAKGLLKKYLDKKYEEYGAGNNIRIYAGQLFVFEDERLITVYPLPSRLQTNLQRYIMWTA